MNSSTSGQEPAFSVSISPDKWSGVFFETETSKKKMEIEVQINSSLISGQMLIGELSFFIEGSLKPEGIVELSVSNKNSVLLFIGKITQKKLIVGTFEDTAVEKVGKFEITISDAAFKGIFKSFVWLQRSQRDFQRKEFSSKMTIFVLSLLGHENKKKILDYVQTGLDLFSFKLCETFTRFLNDRQFAPEEKVAIAKVIKHRPAW